MDPLTSTPKKRIRRLIIIGLAIIIFGAVVRACIAPPANFPAPYELTIENGQTLFSISTELARDHVISSPRLFEVFMLSLGNDKSIPQGQFYFARPLSSLEIALRITTKYFGIEKKKITFPEGFTTREMAVRVTATFPNISTEAFLAATKGKEGYLFPDTYGFFPNATVVDIVKALEDTFTQKIASLEKDISASGHSKKDIITMASIVEKEGNGDNDRAVIAGILWKRLENGMPLQVDAPFFYIFGKQSSELTRSDLATSSPYNTYIHTGLPPTPIGNPGLAAIKATLYPETTDYLYYLHDSERVVHYARTYAEHQANIKKYLK